MNFTRIDNIEILLEKLSIYVESYDELSKLFLSYYVNYGRHRYSAVSKYINEKAISDEQTVFFIQYNLDKLIRNCSKNYKFLNDNLNEMMIEFNVETSLSVERFIEKLEKLEDHILLESQRLVFSQKREEAIFSRKINEFTQNTNRIQYRLDQKAEKLENNLTTSVISVLGIFAAFITTFFGGLSVFGSIMNSLNGVSKFRVVFSILLLGFILFNICFTLLYCISKILERNIGCNVSFNLINQLSRVSELSEDECKLKLILIPIKKMWIWFKIKSARFPFVIAFNIIIIFGMVITILLKYLHYKDIFCF